MEERIVQQVHVNLPFRLVDTYLDTFLQRGLNPEIGLDAVVLDETPAAVFREAARRLRARGCSTTLHGPFIDLSAGSSDPAVRRLCRRRLEQVLPLIPLFRPRTVVCHAGYDWRRYAYFREQWLAHSRDLWAWFARCLHDAGTRLVLENVYETEPAELAALLEGLDPAMVGCCLDVGHQAAFGSVPLLQWIDALGPRIDELHLHDNAGGRDTHMALGKGGIDFAPVWDLLARRRGDWPVLTLEPHREGDLDPSLAVLAQRLGPLLAGED